MENLEKRPFFRADMAGLGKYHMGGYGRIGVCRVKTSMNSYLVCRSQKRYNRPLEVCFLSLNNLTLVGTATFCLILKLYFDLICRNIVLYFLPKK